MKYKYLLSLVFFLSLNFCFAQCDFAIELKDSESNGWAGSSLDLFVNGDLVDDDLSISNGQASEVFTFSVNNNDTIEVIWNPGSVGQDETSYSILDNTGSTLITKTATDLQPNEVNVTCTTCPLPQNIQLEYASDYSTGTSTVDKNEVRFSFDIPSSQQLNSWSYDWVIMPQGESPDLSTAVRSGTYNPNFYSEVKHEITTRMGDSSYSNFDFYIRTNCDDLSLSQWSQNIPFCVNCGQSDPFKPPYYVGFFYDFSNTLGFTEGDGGSLGSGPSTTGQGNWTTDYFANSGVGSSPGSFEISMDGSGDVSWIILPEFDLSDGDHQISYKLAVTEYNAFLSGSDMGSDDKIYLVYKTAAMTSWSILDTYDNSDGLSYTNNGIEEVDLSAISSSSVQIAFVAFENASDPEDYDFFVDDIRLEKNPCQSVFQNLSVDQVTSNSVDISWDASPDESNGYDWFIFNDNENPLFATPLQTGTTSVNQVSITGLNNQTDYDFYIKTKCSNSQSKFSPVFNLQTSCGTFSAPFLESFEPTSDTEECWTTINADNDNEAWNLDDPSNPNQGVESAQIGGYFDDGDDDWLISPKLNLNGTEILSYAVRSFASSNPSDLEVLVSTTGNSISDFTNVLVPNSTITNNVYSVQTVDLSAYSGPVYIAWYVNNTADTYGLFLDDILIADCSAEPFPYLEDFENGDLDIACWNKTDETLVSINSNCGENSGNFLNIKGGIHSIETKVTDVSAENEIQVNFDISNGCNDAAEAGETLNIDYWDGSAWINITTYDPVNLTDEWAPQSFNISSGLTADFKLRFDRQGGSESSDDLSIDNLSIDVPQSCIAPTYLSASNITSSSVELDWAATPSAETGGYEYVLITDGSTPDDTTTPSGSIASGTTTVNITGLTANTAYDAYVRAVCDASTSDKSEWSSKISFSIPPVNDNCSGATSLSVTSDDTQLTNFSTTNASTTPIELNSCDPTANKGVWYTFTAPSPVLEFISGTGNPGITLFEGPDCNSLTEITSSCLDNSTGTISDLTTGNQYYAMVWTDTPKSNADFNLYYKTCLTPLNLTATNITASSVQLDWDATLSGESDGYEYVLVSDGSTPDANTTPTGSVNTGITTANITGLTFETNYDVYVRAVCDVGTSDVSDWSVATSFYTGYCSSVPTYNSGDGISQVELNGTVLTSGGDLTYEDFTGNPIDIQQGVSSNVSITFDSPDTYYTNVWIDLNDNLVFEASELLFVGESEDNNPTIDAAFVTPISATLGNHRMRIGTTDFASTPDPCYSDADGVTVDITVNVTAAPSCVAPTNIIASNTTASSVQLDWDASSSSETGGYEYVLITDGSTPDETTTPTGSVASGVTTVNINGLTQDTVYEAYVRTVCDANTSDISDWSAVESFFTGYCSSVPSSNDGEGISEVTLNGTTLNSGGDITYEDFTGTPIDISQSVTSNLFITFVTSYTYDTHVWIDFNDNLIFEDSELLFSGESTSDDPTTLDASFTTPASAPPGNHRMRIGTADSGQSTPDPCYEDSYGVTIDMTINVVAPSGCISPLNLSASNITSSSVQLNWDATSSAETGGYEYVLITDGSTPDASTTPTGSVNTGETTADITGLTSSTSYDAYVRVICDASTSDISDWSAKVDFNTLIVNDDCDNASALTITTDETQVTSLSTDFATNSNLEDNLSCDSSGSNYGVWYSFTAPATSLEFIQQSGSPEITIFEGSDCNNLTEVTNGCLTSDGTISGLTTGDDYYALVWTDGQTTNVEFTLYYISCLAPTNVSNDALSETTADFSWDATGNASNGYEYVVMPDGDAADTATAIITGTVAAGTTSVQATSLSAATDYDFYVRADCGGGDVSDWSTVVDFTTPCPTVSSFPYNESFDTFLNNCWEEGTGTASNTSSTGSSSWTGGTFNSDNSAKYNMYTTTTAQWLVTENLDLGSTTDYQISLGIAATAWSTSDPTTFSTDDEVGLMISTDGGSTWTSLGTYTDGSTPSNTGQTDIYDLSSYSGVVKFGIYAIASSSTASDHDLYITDFTVEEIPFCADPTGITSSNITNSSADFSWDAVGNASNGYEYVVMPDGDAADTATAVTTGTVAAGTTSVQATGLTVESSYDFYVRADCGSNGSSTFVGPLSFQTTLTNDDVCDAIALTIDATSAGDAFSNFGATSQTNEPDANLNNGVDGSVWFTFVAPTYGNVQVTTDIAGGTLTNTEIAVYKTTDCSDFTTFNQIGFDQDGGTTVNYNSVLNLYDLNAGDTYYVQVDRWGSASEGTFGIEVRDLSYVYNGTAWSPQVPGGNATDINNLIIESGTASIGTTTTANEVSVKPGSVLDLNANLSANVIFESNASGTAQLADATGNSITGDVTVERFIPAGDNNRRAFRFLSSAVNTPNSIKMNWQEGVNNPNSSTNLNPNPGYGTHISGSSSGANGFDATLSGNPSLFTFDNSTQLWSSIDNTDTNTLEVGNAYRLFIRGDRSIDLTNNNSTPTNTTIRSTGNLVTGSLTTGQELPALAQGDAEFSFIGNPYQSIVNFASLDFIGDVNPSFLYIWDANAATQGAYMAIGVEDLLPQILLPGESFFVVNSATVTTPPAIEFNENDKLPGFGGLPPIINPEPQNSPIAKANLELYDNNGIKVDIMKLRFEPGAENGIDDYDAPKIGNFTENLASVNNNTLLSIERRDIPSGSETVPLFINQYQTDQYEFRLDTSNWDDSIEVYIVDSYLNTETLIDANQAYNFSLDANIPESAASNRFSLSFENTTLGIDEAGFGESFSLYPNPTENGFYTIKTEGINAQDVVVKMHNILGQEVFKHSTQVESNGEVRVDASRLSSGVYMVQLTQNESNFNAKLIIK